MFKQIFEIFKSDSLYEQALNECHEMLEIVREMFNESTNSLRHSDVAEIPIEPLPVLSCFAEANVSMLSDDFFNPVFETLLTLFDHTHARGADGERAV